MGLRCNTSLTYCEPKCRFDESIFSSIRLQASECFTYIFVLVTVNVVLIIIALINISGNILDACIKINTLFRSINIYKKTPLDSAEAVFYASIKRFSCNDIYNLITLTMFLECLPFTIILFMRYGKF